MEFSKGRAKLLEHLKLDCVRTMTSYKDETQLRLKRNFTGELSGGNSAMAEDFRQKAF